MNKTIVILLAVTFFVVGIAVYGAHERGQQRQEERVVTRYVLCREIEKLKTGEREEAKRSFRMLGRSLRLLKIKRTKEIVDLARRNRDRQLKRYMARDCVAFSREPPEVEVPE